MMKSKRAVFMGVPTSKAISTVCKSERCVLVAGDGYNNGTPSGRYRYPSNIRRFDSSPVIRGLHAMLFMLVNFVREKDLMMIFKLCLRSDLWTQLLKVL